MKLRLMNRVLQITVAVLASTMMAGCLGSRFIAITPSPAPLMSALPVPLSVRVELVGLRQVNPNAVTPIVIDRASLKKMLATYVTTRKTFQQVLDVQPDSILNIDVTYHLEGRGSTFEYTVDMKGGLLSREGADLGTYSGHSTIEGSGTRMSASADEGPMNRAMAAALEELCMKIENGRPAILAKLGRPSAVLSAEQPRGYGDIDDIQAFTARPDKNRYAVVVGIEQYRQKLPKADYAARDARLVTLYLTRVLGYPEENVILLTDEHSALGDFVKYFEKWLPNNVTPESTVFVYYSGHGAPNTQTGDAFLVPYDGDPAFIDETGYSLKRMYAALGKLPAKEVIVALDSCFSGAGGRSVIAKGSRPLVMNLQSAVALPKNMTVLSASSGDQTSSTYDEKGHGLFTYFMLKGIQNGNVMKTDGSLDLGVLYDYVKPQVQSIARKKYNNEQTPQLFRQKQ